MGGDGTLTETAGCLAQSLPDYIGENTDIPVETSSGRLVRRVIRAGIETVKSPRGKRSLEPSGEGARGERAQEERKDEGARRSKTKVEVILMFKELAEERWKRLRRGAREVKRLWCQDS